MKIFIVGSINIDVSARMQKLPLPGQTVNAESYGLGVGGKGANQAIAANKMGADICFVGAVGNDSFGEIALREMTASGLGTENICRFDNIETGMAIVQVDHHGQNSIAVCAGANASLTADMLDVFKEQIASSKIVLLQREVDPLVNLAAAKIAYEHGVPVCLDPAPVGNLQDFDELLKYCTFITPNETETAELTGIELVDMDTAEIAAKQLLARGVKHVIIKLGARGALLANSKMVRHFAPFKVKVVDTVAAGDSFNAGFAVAYATGKPLEDCVTYGSAAGAIAVTRQGASKAAPTKAEVEELLTSV